MDANLSLTSQVLLTPRRLGLKAGADNTVEILRFGLRPTRLAVQRKTYTTS